MKKLLFVIILFFAASSYSAWMDSIGILERPVSPSSQPGLGTLWIDKTTHDLMFIDSVGTQFNVLLGGGLGGAALNDLSDVDTFTASPTTGNVLGYNGSSWVPSTIASALSGLTDVDTTTATTGEFLKYNGTKWVNSIVPQINALDDIGDVAVSGATSGQVLGFNGTNWVPATGGKTLVGTSPIVITQDANTATFTLDTSTTIHNDLASLQGGTAGEYYHLTQAKYNAVENLTASGTQTNFIGSTPLPISSYSYYGDSVTDGSIRTYQTGGALITEKRISGSWTEIFRLDNL